MRRAVNSTRIKVCHNECMGLCITCVAQKLALALFSYQARCYTVLETEVIADFQGAFSTRTHFSALYMGTCMYIQCRLLHRFAFSKSADMARKPRENSREKHNRDSVKQEKRQDRDGTRHTYLLIVLLPVNINKCVRDAPNNDKSFANGQTGTSANNSFGFNTTQHNTTQLKKSKELEDSHPPQSGGGGGYGGGGGGDGC